MDHLQCLLGYALESNTYYGFIKTQFILGSLIVASHHSLDESTGTGDPVRRG
jgi:hypothetical protein